MAELGGGGLFWRRFDGFRCADPDLQEVKVVWFSGSLVVEFGD